MASDEGQDVGLISRLQEGIGKLLLGNNPERKTNRRNRPREFVRVEYIDYELVVARGWHIVDGDIFEKASRLDLTSEFYGELLVERGDTILETAEKQGLNWPFSCRGGACANCAVFVSDGDVSIPANTILTDGLVEHGYRLSCIGEPLEADTKLIYNIQHHPAIDDLKLPPRR